jgi:hypothetical protein
MLNSAVLIILLEYKHQTVAKITDYHNQIRILS